MRFNCMLRFLVGRSLGRLLAVTLVIGFALLSDTPQAEDKSPEQRARLGTEVNPSNALHFTPIELNGGTKLTLISPEKWHVVTGFLSKTLSETHQKYGRLFGELRPVTTAIRLMDEETFFQTTGAPRWTNAMFFRGQIIIPLTNDQPIDFDNLSRSIKHEYTHAVINALTAGRSPGWLDEGIAQWAEGTENPALKPALRAWLKRNEPVSLGLLQGGFTKLEPEMVPASYAESLYATYAIINTYGFQSIRRYFDELRSGNSKTMAFEEGFGITEERFEERLGLSLKKWLDKESTSSVNKT